MVTNPKIIRDRELILKNNLITYVNFSKKIRKSKLL